MYSSLIHEFESHKEGTRLRGAVEIAGIAILPFIQIFLEAVEDILYTCVELQLDVVVQEEGVVQLQIEVEELRSVLHTVLLDVAGKVRHHHPAGVDAG